MGSQRDGKPIFAQRQDSFLGLNTHLIYILCHDCSYLANVMMQNSSVLI